MAESALNEHLAVRGLEVDGERVWEAAALRYFETQGDFASAVQAVTGTPLPRPLGAAALEAAGAGGAGIVAWRSPTETLLLGEHAGLVSQIRERLSSVPGGCVVELTGGLRVLRLRGPGVAELLCRLGGNTVTPAVSEARRGRLADVPVLAVSVRSLETLLVVDRAYAQHLLGWIRATLAEWPADGN